MIINPGQRFEFFVVPKDGVEVAEGDYPIYMKPITEVETFDSLDADVRMGSITYTSEVLDVNATNRVENLASLLPSTGVDGAAVPQEDLKDLSYITSVAELEALLGAVPKVATVTGATSDGAGTIVMPDDAPHHLEVGHEIRIGGVAYAISELDADAATFHLDGTPAAGTVDFEYNLYKVSTVANGSRDGEIVEVLTDHYFYRGIAFPVEAFAEKIVRQRKFSFAIHCRGLAGMGSGSTWMNESPYNDFNRTVSYLGTNEEFLMQNKSDVIHQFHIHVNEYQVVAYRDGIFGATIGDESGKYDFANEIEVAGKAFEDTTTIPAGVLVEGAEEAAAGSRGEVRMRTKFRDYTGLFLMHCHLLDDQDMGMMQQVEVVAPGYVQAPFGTHNHG